MKTPISIFAAGCLAFAVGCGGGGDGEDGGPASIVPADAPVYFEAVVRPEGEAASGAEGALGKIIGSDDPGQVIVDQIESAAAADDENFSYEEDIEPWLGERAGIYPTSLAGESDVVVALETTDSDRAIEFLSSQGDTPEEKEYEGVDYQLDSDGDAVGVVEGLLVFGDEESFKAAVDNAEEDDSLAGSDEFEDAIDELPEDRLATLYAIPKTFIEAIPEEEIDAQGRDIILESLGDDGEEPVLGSMTASDAALSLEVSAAGGAEVSAEESTLVGELPAAAWLGLGVADIGAGVERGVASVDESDVPGLSAATIRQQLNAVAGIDLDADVVNALGDGAFFLQGTSEADLGGALVIQSTDPTASARLLIRIQGLIKRRGDPSEVRVQPLASTGGDVGFQLVDPTGELPQPIQVVQRGDRIVAGYGAASVEQGLTAQTGTASLAGNPAFTSAQSAIGDLGIDAFLSFAPIFAFAEASGAASDPKYQQAKPYLDAFDFLAAGSSTEDDRTTARFIVGLK